jgi:hypothetical protein
MVNNNNWCWEIVFVFLGENKVNWIQFLKALYIKKTEFNQINILIFCILINLLQIILKSFF